jgi:type II secretory pathway pseudopilin PulG
MSFKHRGDTLVEVLFAFAILSLVMSTAFSGALSAYKSSLAAQNQTQANFVAQYQAEALKTYRDALEWDSAIYPSFLTGFVPASGKSLPAMTSYLNQSKTFCMFLENPNFGKDTTEKVYWRIEENSGTCNNTIRTLLAPELGNNSRIEITLTTADIRSPNQVTANIKVIWTPRNSRVEQSVVNSVLLTK